MNNYLLDTHILLWWLKGDVNKLSTEQLNAIADPANNIFISQVSLWEIVLKLSIGKLSLGFPASEITSEVDGFQNLSIKDSHIFAVAELPMLHKDPFDRLIVAQCKLEKLEIITTDEQVEQYFG